MLTVKLLRDARIMHKAGEIVNVSPAEYNFLVSLGSAVPVSVKASAEPKTETKTEVKTETKKAETVKKAKTRK